MMCQQVNLNTWSTLQVINKVALITVTEENFFDKQQWAAVTHFAMMQYSFKKVLNLHPSHAKVTVGKELEQLHSQYAFNPQDTALLAT